MGVGWIRRTGRVRPARPTRRAAPPGAAELPQCVEDHRRLRPIGLILLAILVLAVAIGVVLTGPLNNDAGGLAFLPALVVTLAVIIVFSRSNWVLATRERRRTEP